MAATRNILRGLVSTSLVAVCVLAAAPAAQAGKRTTTTRSTQSTTPGTAGDSNSSTTTISSTSSTTSAGSPSPSSTCGSQVHEQPFSRWGDTKDYVLAPGGTFEAGTSGWLLSKAAIVGENESYFVHKAGESKSLSIQPGGSAISAPICLEADYPTFRFFARSTGAAGGDLKVEVLFAGAGGTSTYPAGTVTPSSGWKPSPVMATVFNRFCDKMGGTASIQLRFTPQGPSGWLIDDVYVDPHRRN